MSTTIQECTSDRVREFLSNPSAYPDDPTEVRTVETHISWVFITDRFAYKLKKPVKFEFIDFSTVALRHQACENELRLNRRLAPTVYIAVLPVTAGSDGSLELGGDGRAVDWVVQMRRLPSDKALDRVMREGRLTHKEATTIAAHLANFYARLPPQSVGPDDFRQAIDGHVRANEAALSLTLPDDRARLRRIHSAQLRFLHIQQPLFDNRVLSGRIIDGHGDLRPEHIYLEHPPAVIDCIEFSTELRRVDVADELNFLAMECQRLGHTSLGQLVLATYHEVSGDAFPSTISSFYRSYRACVRSKVATLQHQQRSEEQRRLLTRLTHQYLDWADHYASELGRPCLLMIYGLMGTGKSTLANRLAELLDIEVLSTDRERRAMFGASVSPASYGTGLYQPETRNKIYDSLFRRAGSHLDSGQSVILDGAFLSRELRDRANDSGRRHGAAVIEVLCECPRKTALHRIKKRIRAGTSQSEARVDLYDGQTSEFQPSTAETPTIHVDTTVDVSRQLRVVCEALRHNLF